MKLLRQGDVLLLAVRALPKDAVARNEKGDVILAFGESTGHAHRIKQSAKCRLWDAGAERFLQVLERAELRHEEHQALVLEPGIYRLPKQVAYQRGELKRVTD